MKKQLLLAGFIAASATSIAQTYFSDDFQGAALTTNNAWNVQQVSNPGGINPWVLGTVGGQYAKASNYVSTVYNVADWWLITPAINLSSATNPTLTFDNVTRYAGPAMKVMISTNYSGSGLPSTATWTDITSLFTLDTDNASWTFVSAGSGDLTSYAGGNVYIAFQYTGTATDGATWEVDNISVIEGTVTPPGVIPIADVQATTGGDQSDMLGQTATVGGRVTAVKSGSGFWIQDKVAAWSGIYVFNNTNTVAIGDSVILTGTVAEFAPGASTEKATQIANLTAFSNEGAFAPYGPMNLSTSNVNAEMYEGVLVKVSNASTTAIPDAFNEWDVNDGSGAVKVDDFIYLTTPTPVLGDVYNVTGVVSHSFGFYKILPRDANDVDFVSGASVSEMEEEMISVYPNPSNGVINIKNANNETIEVYNTLGSKVLTTKQTQFNLKDGLYLIKVGNKTFRVLVK
jgi:hypothetical protein